VRRPAPTPRSGMARKLAVSAVVIAILLVGADLGLRAWAEGWVAGRVAQSMGLSRDPRIELHGFPFLVQFARGRFDRVELDADELLVEGLMIESARLDLEQVRFARSQLLARGSGAIRARRGSGEVVVTDRALSALVQAEGVPVEVEFLGPKIRVSTTLRIDEQELDASATGRLRFEEGAVSFSPDRVTVGGPFTVPADTVAFEVPLPELLPGVRYQGVRVGSGRATLEVAVREAAIRVPPAA
jgi:hypothetical protein